MGWKEGSERSFGRSVHRKYTECANSVQRNRPSVVASRRRETRESGKESMNRDTCKGLEERNSAATASAAETHSRSQNS